MRRRDAQMHDQDEPCQTLLLDFQFRSNGECILITRSPFPLRNPQSVVAAFGKGSFNLPGAIEARVDLLYALEQEFTDWSEFSRPLSFAVSHGARTREECWIIAITKLRKPEQLHRAHELFLKCGMALSHLVHQSTHQWKATR
jgi:hypothetical protein